MKKKVTKKKQPAKKRTSAAIAKIAGRVMAKYEERYINVGNVTYADGLSWSDVVALAASCLSQTEPK